MTHRNQIIRQFKIEFEKLHQCISILIIQGIFIWVKDAVEKC